SAEFSGFRFPFTKPGYWSLLALDEHDYAYESSIGADNLDFFHGSIMPYNLVITEEGFYRSTDILEIAPTYHDDYFFLRALVESQDPDSIQLQKNIMVLRQYLENYWNYAVKPYNGVMVYLGHPKYTGYSDSTLSALLNLVKVVKHDNTWITTLDEVADFRKKLDMLHFYASREGKKVVIEVVAPEKVSVSQVCLNFTGKIKNVSSKQGKVRTIKNAEVSRIVFDAGNGQSITILQE
ncbi:MAG: hypothetical protein MUC31_03495, partial [Bacteroidales bacterium]|nr:hypothetical protein [Bacteroidales bacterium]